MNTKKYYEKQKLHEKLNPRSRGSSYSADLQFAMANARKRDNNTCQWQNCNLTQKETQIQVNHIFPIWMIYSRRFGIFTIRDFGLSFIVTRYKSSNFFSSSTDIDSFNSCVMP